MKNSLTSHAVRTTVLTLSFVPIAALAALGDPNPLPEPGSWILVGLGLAAAIAVTLKKRK